jgi:hypothetical protein
MIALAAATGIVAGGTAAWSAIDPGKPGDSPAPLWSPPTQRIERQAAGVSPSPDDHGGRRDDTSGSPIPREPGDDNVGLRRPSSTGTIEPGDDKGGLRKSGPGKSSDDPAGHH